MEKIMQNINNTITVIQFALHFSEVFTFVD